MLDSPFNTSHYRYGHFARLLNSYTFCFMNVSSCMFCDHNRFVVVELTRNWTTQAKTVRWKCSELGVFQPQQETEKTLMVHRGPFCMPRYHNINKFSFLSCTNTWTSLCRWLFLPALNTNSMRTVANTEETGPQNSTYMFEPVRPEEMCIRFDL